MNPKNSDNAKSHNKGTISPNKSFSKSKNCINRGLPILFLPESWGFYVYLNWLVILLVFNPWFQHWKTVIKNWVYCYSFFQWVFWYFQVFVILLKKVIIVIHTINCKDIQLKNKHIYKISYRWGWHSIYQYTSIILVGCYHNDYSWIWRHLTNNYFRQIDR